MADTPPVPAFIQDSQDSLVRASSSSSIFGEIGNGLLDHAPDTARSTSATMADSAQLIDSLDTASTIASTITSTKDDAAMTTMPSSRQVNDTSSHTTTTDRTTQTQAEKEMKEKYRDVLRFVVNLEEYGKGNSCFIKEFNSDSQVDWRENHFMMKDDENETDGSEKAADDESDDKAAEEEEDAAGNKKTKAPTENAKTESASAELSEEQLGKLKVAELKTELKSRNVSFSSSMLKQDLLDLLKKSVDLPVVASVEAPEKGKKDDAADVQVILTKYQYDPISKKLGWKCNQKETHQWLRIQCPPPPSSKKPEVTDETDKDVRRFLEHLRRKSPERFQDCQDLDGMISLLTSQDIPVPQKGFEKIRAFVTAAVQYSTSKSSEVLTPVYERLYEWTNNANKATSELVAGFGHVRMVYSNKKGESQLVNGPLFEVLLEAKLQLGSNGFGEIIIGPTTDTKITVNAEVMSAIVAGGGGNSSHMDDLYHRLENTAISTIRLDNPDSYLEFLRVAQMLRVRGEVRCSDHPELHVPPSDLEALVLTDAWCLMTRKRSCTTFSTDARSLIQALDQGKREITEPIRALVRGPMYLKKYWNDSSCSLDEKMEHDSLVYPLPASKLQRETCIRFLVNKEPVFIVEGPPGTGKTHSIVNVAATALSEGKTVLVTSSNNRALRAFLDKLPKRFRALGLDMSCCKEGGMLEFQQALETFYINLQSTKTNGNASKVTKRIARKKRELKKKQEEVQSANEAKQLLIANDELEDAFELALELSQKEPWLMKFVVTANIDLVSTSTIIENIQSDTGHVTFGSCNDIFDDDFLHHVQGKAEAVDETRSGANAFSDFKLESNLSQSEKSLSLVKVDGKPPNSQADWKIVLASINFRKDDLAALRACGCSDNYIFDDQKEASFRPEFLVLIKDGLRLKAMLEPLPKEQRDTLCSAVQGARSGRIIQDECRELISEIQSLEAELLYVKVVAALKPKLDDNAMSALKTLCLSARRLNSRALDSDNKNPGDRSSRLFDSFVEKFKETTKFMPFLVMTNEQVSKCLPPDHTFDVGIMDETSQSTCTAINIMARVRQMLVVGDDKQVSPSQVGLSEERIRGLKAHAPAIPTAEQLGPEYSFFDLFQASFPKSSVFLSEHYRCDPRIIAISNKLFYYSELKPLRLASQSPAIEDLVVKGESEKKRNQLEAQKIADCVGEDVQRYAERSEFETIGVISLGGDDQRKLLKDLIDEKISPLSDEYGSDVVERHKILVGTPQQFQGDERDIIYLSTVHSPQKEGRKLQTDKEDNWKSWNVALTRARNKMILYRSYGIKDLHPTDTRQKIIREFTKANKAKDKPKAMVLEADPLMEKVEAAVSDALKSIGYRVEKKGGDVWGEALCIESSIDGKSHCALVHIENAGESKEEWMALVDQQRSLEGAGRACLRVDCLSMVMNFRAVLDEVLNFLEDSGLPKPAKRSAEDAIGASAAKKAKLD